jgi:poly(3-hydroxybutyrate) depolymerase
MRWLVGTVLAGCVAMAAWAQPVQSVQIDPSGWSSSPAPLQAYWFAPQGSGVRPAVVMLHGCGGAYAKD